MIPFAGKRQQKHGLSPGSVVYTGVQHLDSAVIDLIRYDAGSLEEEPDVTLDYALAALADGRVAWLNVTGLHDTDLIQRIGEAVGLHPLIMEDIVSVGQRPKVEFDPDYIYVVLRMLSIAASGSVDNEQVSLVLGKNAVVSFQEKPGDVFSPVRERIRRGKGRIRSLGPDYLFYALIDVLVDASYLVLEDFGERGQALEDQVMREATPEVLQALSVLKREALQLRRAVWPVRELLNTLQREESPLLSDTVLTFLRDAYDHSVQVLESVESLRELLASLHDYYLSSLSYRMNEVMKVLTIIGTIFIPLSFLVGVYGMNFERMPELRWRWAYPALWGVMITVSVAMLAYFRRRRWL